MMRWCLIVSTVFALFAGHVMAQEALKIVEAKGEALVSEDTTPAEAKAIALNNARRRALEEAVGIVVQGSTSVYNYQVINDLVIAATKGLIVREKIIENICGMREGQIFCAARIEAQVKPLSLERKGNLRVASVLVRRPDKAETAASAVFQNNDEIQISVTASEEAFVNLFSVDQYGGIAKLFPNDYAGRKRIIPDTVFTFPSNEQRSSGIKLRVQPPKGLRKAVESVLVVLTKEKVDLLAGGDIQAPTVSDLMRELSDIDPSNWAQDTVGYEVNK